MNVQMTRHALQRALDMRLEPYQIQRALHAPKVIQSQSDPHKQYWRKGRIVLVVMTDGEPRVVTVLWATEKAFADDMRVASCTDRSANAFVSRAS